MFLKVPVIIIMRFGENNVRDNIYQFTGIGGGFNYGRGTRAQPILISNSTSF